MRARRTCTQAVKLTWHDTLKNAGKLTGERTNIPWHLTVLELCPSCATRYQHTLLTEPIESRKVITYRKTNISPATNTSVKHENKMIMLRLLSMMQLVTKHPSLTCSCSWFMKLLTQLHIYRKELWEVGSRYFNELAYMTSKDERRILKDSSLNLHRHSI